MKAKLPIHSLTNILSQVCVTFCVRKQCVYLNTKISSVAPLIKNSRRWWSINQWGEGPKHEFLLPTKVSYLCANIIGTKVFTSLAAIPNSAALDIFLLQVGWQAGCAQTHPKSCGSPLGNQHIAALTGAVGIPSAFQGDQDKLPVASAPTQQSSRPW